MKDNININFWLKRTFCPLSLQKLQFWPPIKKNGKSDPPCLPPFAKPQFWLSQPYVARHLCIYLFFNYTRIINLKKKKKQKEGRLGTCDEALPSDSRVFPPIFPPIPFIYPYVSITHFILKHICEALSGSSITIFILKI